MKEDIRELHGALVDLVSLMNRAQLHAILTQQAGISIDGALVPLLIRIRRLGPIGVVQLAELIGRDHSTVSRQVAKMEELGLITRHPGQHDARVREAIITKKGWAVATALEDAREKLYPGALANWSAKDRKDLARLMRKLEKDFTASISVTARNQSTTETQPSAGRAQIDCD